MSKIHIALVGGQPAPVYNGIAYINPDKVVLIYSDQTIENARAISEAIKIPYEKRKCDPVDFAQIEIKMGELIEQYKNDEVSVNISSGTKNWAYYFAQYPNATIFFVDQNNVVWDFTHKAKSEVKFDPLAQFKLYGTMPSGLTRFKDFTEADKQVLNSIIELQNFGGNTFMQLVSKMKNRPDLTSYNTTSGSYIKWDKQDKKMIIQIVKSNGKILKELKSPHVRHFVLNAGWFEYKVAEILSRWRYTSEIWLNTKFNYESGAPKNEIDIIVNAGMKFLFVEVKTQIEDNTDIDKFSRAVENFSGYGSKKLFVTQMAMSEKAIEKCKDNGVIPFSMDHNNLNMNTENALFLLLDSSLSTIEA